MVERLDVTTDRKSQISKTDRTRNLNKVSIFNREVTAIPKIYSAHREPHRAKT